MATQKHYRLAAIFALVLAFVMGLQALADAAPAGSFEGEVTIQDNRAQKIHNEGGSSGGGKFLGIIGGGGGKGIRDAELVVQGVNVTGVKFDADVSILKNRAYNVHNDGANLNVQGVAVRR